MIDLCIIADNPFACIIANYRFACIICIHTPACGKSSGSPRWTAVPNAANNLCTRPNKYDNTHNNHRWSQCGMLSTLSQSIRMVAHTCPRYIYSYTLSCIERCHRYAMATLLHVEYKQSLTIIRHTNLGNKCKSIVHTDTCFCCTAYLGTTTIAFACWY